MSNSIYTIIIYPIIQILEFVFVFAQKFFKETGLSIICISGAVSILCLPLYMVAESWQDKDFNAKGEMKTNMTFMTNGDVPSLAMKELIKNPVNPFTSNSINTTEHKNNPLLILIDRVHDKNENDIDNIFDEKNWLKPEKTL